MAGISMVFSDFIISFLWVWSGVSVKLVALNVHGLGHDARGEILKCCLSIINMFFFAFLGKITKGGAYNPLTVLSSSISSDLRQFLYTVGARIPAQVMGSITAVTLILDAFPEIGHGPRLNIDISRGAMTEGFLTFTIVVISLGLARKIPGSFFMKTWISSVSKLTLHILGSDLTGGCMNPASVMGWAYARGDHITKEHILVYWLAPVEATLLAVWICKVLFGPLNEKKVEKGSKRAKSD